LSGSGSADVELSGAGWVIYAHSKENGAVIGNFSANFKRGLEPGTSLPRRRRAMGSLPTSASLHRLFVKSSYYIRSPNRDGS